MKQLLLRSFIRGLGAVAAMATLPLLSKAVAHGVRHGTTAAKKAWQAASDEACAARRATLGSSKGLPSEDAAEVDDNIRF